LQTRSDRQWPSEARRRCSRRNVTQLLAPVQCGYTSRNEGEPDEMEFQGISMRPRSRSTRLLSHGAVNLELDLIRTLSLT
jgi:hypothetical protein